MPQAAGGATGFTPQQPNDPNKQGKLTSIIKSLQSNAGWTSVWELKEEYIFHTYFTNHDILPPACKMAGSLSPAYKLFYLFHAPWC